jgi:hypothetical protein
MLGGKAILRNTLQQDSHVDMELLFNALVSSEKGLIIDSFSREINN